MNCEHILVRILEEQARVHKQIKTDFKLNAEIKMWIFYSPMYFSYVRIYIRWFFPNIYKIEVDEMQKQLHKRERV